MNIEKYKKYVRTTNVTDEELTELVKSIVQEIAVDTLFFKKEIGLVLNDCIDILNVRELFEMNNNLDHSEIDKIEFNVTSGNVVDKIISNIVEENKDGKSDCELNDSMNIETVTTKEKNSTGLFLSTLDIVYLHKDNDSNSMFSNTISVVNDWFTIADKDIFVKKRNLNEYLNLKEEPRDLLIKCAYVPDVDEIDEEVEKDIQHTIIAGLKFYSNDLYMSPPDLQSGEYLSRRYYAYKRQLRSNNPFIMAQQESVRETW